MLGLPRFMIQAKYIYQKNGRFLNYVQFDDQLMENLNGKMKRKLAQQSNRRKNWMWNCMSDIIFSSIGSVQKNMVSFHMNEKEIESNNKPLMVGKEFELKDIGSEAEKMLFDGRQNVKWTDFDHILHNERIDAIVNLNTNTNVIIELEEDMSNLSVNSNLRSQNKRKLGGISNANNSLSVRRQRKKRKNVRYEMKV